MYILPQIYHPYVAEIPADIEVDIILKIKSIYINLTGNKRSKISVTNFEIVSSIVGNKCEVYWFTLRQKFCDKFQSFTLIAESRQVGGLLAIFYIRPNRI